MHMGICIYVCVLQETNPVSGKNHVLISIM